MDDIPTKLFLETSLPTSASPYPSPSSAFYPPPIPASHEFANKLGASLVSNKRYRGSGGSNPSASASTSAAGLTSPTNGTGTGTSAPSSGLGSPSTSSSHRGSASGPSPLATSKPLVAQLDGVAGSPEAKSAGPDGKVLREAKANSPNRGANSPDEKVKVGSDAKIRRLNDAGESTTSYGRINPDSALGTTSASNGRGGEGGSNSILGSPAQGVDPRTPPRLVTAIPSSTPSSNSTSNSGSTHPSNTIGPCNISNTNPINPTITTSTSNPHEVTTPSTNTPSLPTAAVTPTNPASNYNAPTPSNPTSTTPSKRTSQILEALTPIRAAPPSPAPSRRGSLIRRGSSRRWSKGSGAVSGGGMPGTDLTGATLMGGVGGVNPIGSRMSGIGIGWLGGDTVTMGGTSSTVSEDGSVQGDTPTIAASKRASRRLSAFSALASTTEGEVASFSDPPITNERPSKPETPTPTDAPMPTEAETETEPVSATELQSSADPALSQSDPYGTTALKPIIVADFAYLPTDPRHSKRPLQLLRRAEKASLSPEEHGHYAIGECGEEWEENAEEEEEDQWGWVGVSGLRPRLWRGDGEEGMTPRFGYSSQYDTDVSTPTGTGYNNALSATNGDGGEGELDPDSPLPPGIYRALYAFEAEGTAEMSLSEGQLVRVVGRGGGVGWAVVERGWRPENSGSALASQGGVTEGDHEGDGGGGGGLGVVLDVESGGEESTGALGMAGQALVPEGYLEIWMLDGEDRDAYDF